jgi:uncharacterized protein (TIGR02145 family)
MPPMPPMPPKPPISRHPRARPMLEAPMLAFDFVADDSRVGACPSGWHLPSDAEWTQLVNYLGGVSVAGGKLKSTTGWVSPNAGATNESNWSGLPGGALFSNVHFDDIGYYGSWWSSTGYNAGNAWYRDLFYYYGIVYRDKSYKTIGFSVRCLRDN